MATYKFQLEERGAIIRQIQAETSRVFNEILKRSLKNKQFQSQVVETLMFFLKRTDVWRGLGGAFAGDVTRDLQAHFGLEDGYLSIVESEIEFLLKSIISVTGSSITFGGKTVAKASKATINFNINFKNIEREFPAIDSGTFISENGFEVPWLEWLLFGGSVDNYDLLYNIGGDNPIVNKSSRTGRALMMSSRSSDTFERQWSTNEVLYDQFFFFKIFQNDEFIDNVSNILFDYMIAEARNV